MTDIISFMEFEGHVSRQIAFSKIIKTDRIVFHATIIYISAMLWLNIIKK